MYRYDPSVSEANGFATATLELLNGYPGYFLWASDGSYIFALDQEFGLPVRFCGDAGPDTHWMGGFNRGVKAYIDQYGLPWNSRLSCVPLFADLSRYFQRYEAQKTRLQPGGQPFTPQGCGVALSWQTRPEPPALGRVSSSIKLESDSLFKDPKIVHDAMMAYRTGAPSAAPPPSPKPPPLEPGIKLVSLRFYDSAQCVECVPAPAGSHLVVFRFSEFTPSGLRQPGGPKYLFAALDTQLADWIPDRLFRHAL
jgi:hypothetical protein